MPKSVMDKIREWAGLQELKKGQARVCSCRPDQRTNVTLCVCTRIGGSRGFLADNF